MSVADYSRAYEIAREHGDALVVFEEWMDELGDVSRGDLADWDDDDDRREIVRAALAWMIDHGADDLTWQAFVDHALDIEITGTFSEGEWSVSDVALLVSYGGPNVRYRVHGLGTVRVSVAWGSDVSEYVVDSGLADYLNDLADDLVAGAR